MADLISKREACEHLRFDFDEDSNGDYVTSDYDGWLSTWIPVVSEQVALWVKEDARLYQPELDSSGIIVTDSSGEPVPAIPQTVRYVVKAACLVELASLNRYLWRRRSQCDRLRCDRGQPCSALVLGRVRLRLPAPRSPAAEKLAAPRGRKLECALGS